MLTCCTWAEEMIRRDRLVRLSPSMMAREIHRIHPVAPFFQSLIGPGAQPLTPSIGPQNAKACVQGIDMRKTGTAACKLFRGSALTAVPNISKSC